LVALGLINGKRPDEPGSAKRQAIRAKAWGQLDSDHGNSGITMNEAEETAEDMSNCASHEAVALHAGTQEAFRLVRGTIRGNPVGQIQREEKDHEVGFKIYHSEFKHSSFGSRTSIICNFYDQPLFGPGRGQVVRLTP
jgi:hypothetical protein